MRQRTLKKLAFAVWFLFFASCTATTDRSIKINVSTQSSEFQQPPAKVWHYKAVYPYAPAPHGPAYETEMAYQKPRPRETKEKVWPKYGVMVPIKPELQPKTKPSLRDQITRKSEEVRQLKAELEQMKEQIEGCSNEAKQEMEQTQKGIDFLVAHPPVPTSQPVKPGCVCARDSTKDPCVMEDMLDPEPEPLSLTAWWALSKPLPKGVVVQSHGPVEIDTCTGLVSRVEWIRGLWNGRPVHITFNPDGSILKTDYLD